MSGLSRPGRTTALALLSVVLGCSVSRMVLPSSEKSVKQLAPSDDPGAKAILVYGGQDVDAKLDYSLAGGVETIRLLGADGEELEREVYRSEAGAFLLVDAADDRFDPPLPILSDARTGPWSGKVVSGGVPHEAKATVALSQDKVPSHPVPLDATLATVTLQLDSGAPTPAERTLKFWFVKGRGLVAREFGFGVKRLPGD